MSIRWFGYGPLPYKNCARRHQPCSSSLWPSRGQQGAHTPRLWLRPATPRRHKGAFRHLDHTGSKPATPNSPNHAHRTSTIMRIRIEFSQTRTTSILRNVHFAVVTKELSHYEDDDVHTAQSIKKAEGPVLSVHNRQCMRQLSLLIATALTSLNANPGIASACPGFAYFTAIDLDCEAALATVHRRRPLGPSWAPALSTTTGQCQDSCNSNQSRRTVNDLVRC